MYIGELIMGKYIANLWGYANGFRKTILTMLINRDFSIGKSLRLFHCANLQLYKKAKGKIDKNVKIDNFARVVCVNGGVLLIGDNVGIGAGNYIICRDSINIGSDTIIGPNVMIYDHDHIFSGTEGVDRKKYKTDEIVIGKKCWIGANSVILKGTHIGNNCVIAAGSIVKGVIPDCTVLIQKRDTSIVTINKKV